jgi:hypothetical protein
MLISGAMAPTIMKGRFALLAALLLVAPPAAAQSFSVTVNEIPSETTVDAGGGETFDANVTMQGQGFECLQAVTFTGNATLEASIPSSAPPNASISTTDGSAEYTVPEGPPRDSPTSDPYVESQTIQAGFTVDPGVKQNYSATLTLTGEWPTVSPGPSCTGEELGGVSTSEEITVNVVRDVAPQPETPDDGGDSDEDDTATPPADNGTDPASGDSSDEGDSGIPVPWHVAPLALAGVALLLRRGD